MIGMFCTVLIVRLSLRHLYVSQKPGGYLVVRLRRAVQYAVQ